MVSDMMIIKKYSIPFILVSSLILCGITYTNKTNVIESNINAYIEKQVSSESNVYNCIDEIIIDRLNGFKESTVFTQLHPVKVYSFKNMYIPNGNKLIIKELDQTCGGN